MRLTLCAVPSALARVRPVTTFLPHNTETNLIQLFENSAPEDSLGLSRAQHFAILEQQCAPEDGQDLFDMVGNVDDRRDELLRAQLLQAGKEALPRAGVHAC